MSKTKELGQYYTRDFIVDFCIKQIKDKIDISKFDTVIEPSAGTGEFSTKIKPLFDNSLFYDIEPKHPDIIKQNFLKLKLNTNPNKTITIGNPPFGKNSSLAVEFFNKCSDYSNVIAFIVPKTFKKESVHNKLNEYFHCMFTTDLFPKAFYTEEAEEYDVPCCFQIWVKSPVKRETNQTYLTKWLEFSTEKKGYDIVIRRAGSKAGEVVNKKGVDGLYYCKILDDKVIKILSSDIYLKYIRSIANNTAGNRSISRKELIDTLDYVNYLI